MKVKLVYLIIFLTFLSVPISANALTDMTATRTSDLKQRMSDLKPERQNVVSQAKEQTKGQIQEVRDQFKERLQSIKDTRKRIVTERLDSNISLANTKHTARFAEVLTKLQALLDKISQEVKDAKTILLVKDAQAKIDLAKEAVVSQTVKVYTIQIDLEANLKVSAEDIIKQFRNDLMQTYKLVVDAKQKVTNLRENGVMMKKEASSSANL